MNLGARFKAREVGLLLQATLKRLDGHGVIRIKPPPSNRLWFSFERMPKMELLIEPIVGSTQVAWGPVLRIIESRIREVIEESVVLPYYDDIPFTDTIDQRFRGGIWHKHKKNPPPPPPTPTPSREAKDPFKEPFEAENFPTPTNEPETEEPLLTLNGQKHQSTPTLVTTPAPVVDDDKAASIMGLMPDAEEPRKARTPSIKSKDSSSSERKPKAARPPTFTSITPSPPAPSIGTETFNVSAMRGDRTADSSESTNSASSAISAIKSRTSTSPQTPSPIAIARPGRRPTSSSGMQEEAEPNDHDEPQFPMSMGSISGGSAQAFGSNYSQPNHLGTNSRSQTASSTGSKGPLESIAAIGTATAAVKKWYTTRKNSNLNGSSVTTETQHLRHLPPPTIPPPPIPKRTAPMNMPNKRKSLPPPIAPSRKSRHMAPALPPRDPRDEGEMLVVAAPESEPTTPKEERPASWSGLESWDRKDDIQSWENKDEGKWDRDEGKGGQSWDKDERKGREHSEAKGGEPSSPVKAAQSWDRKEDSAELWHPAEEAEIRNRTTWGAGEL